MPIYEYRCASCGHELEVLQKLSDAPLTECPACHRAALQKKVSAAGFQLKGSGWYVTDFRNKDAKKPAKDAAKPADKPNGTEATSDAKAPAAASSETTQSDSKSGGASETKSTTPSDKSG
jgi:putative FmdB family regulatory protein